MDEDNLENLCKNASLMEHPLHTTVKVYLCSLSEGLCGDPHQYSCFNKDIFRLVDGTAYNHKDDYTR